MGSSSGIASYHLTGLGTSLGLRPHWKGGNYEEVDAVDGFVPESVDVDEDSGVDAFVAGSDAVGFESDDVPDSAGLLSEELPPAFGA